MNFANMGKHVGERAVAGSKLALDAANQGYERVNGMAMKVLWLFAGFAAAWLAATGLLVWSDHVVLAVFTGLLTLVALASSLAWFLLVQSKLEIVGAPLERVNLLVWAVRTLASTRRRPREPRA